MSELIGHVSLAQSGQFPPLVVDYINKEEKLKTFVTAFCAPQGYTEAISHRQYNEANRPVLVAEMEKHYRSLNLWEADSAEKVRDNLRALAQPHTYTVTTGHQLNIFTGPLYCIYKILTTIRLAEELKELHPDKKFVPVFWLATEDHDFDEINHIHLFGKKLEWAYPAEVKGQPVGRLPLSGIDEVIKQLEDLRLPASLLEPFKEAYLQSSNLADATFKLYHHLFASYGLLILQPDNAVLKQLFSSFAAEDIFEKKAHNEVAESIRLLEDEGYKIQVNPREINHFYITEKGNRERISGDNNYQINNTDIVFSAEELKQELKLHPERFSPNVIMRPLYQEVILPNLGYVGGPGEIAYWLELKKSFEKFNVSFPVLHLRNSFVTLGEKAQKQIISSGLSVADFFQDEHILVDLFLQKSGEQFSVSEEIKQINAFLDVFTSKMELVDKSKVGAWVKRINEQKALIKKMGKDFVDIVKESNDNQIDKLLKVRQHLLPENALAERSENILGKAKNEAFTYIETMYKLTHPFEQNVACVKI